MKNRDQLLREYESSIKQIDIAEQKLDGLHKIQNSALIEGVAEIGVKNKIMVTTNDKYTQNLSGLDLLLNNFKTEEITNFNQSQYLTTSLSAEELVRTDVLKKACMIGDIEQFNKVIEKITEINFYDKTGYSALMHAISNNFLHGASRLFQENANLTEKDVFVLTKDCGNSFLRKVLDEFAVKTIPTSLKNFLIQDSCINQQKEIFDSALLQLDNINCQDHKGKTALIHATEHSFLYAIDKLLEHKADAHITDWYGNNALHLALYQKKDLIAEKLIKYDETITGDKDIQGRLPLYIVLEQASQTMIKLLFSENNAGYALIHAIEKSNYPIVGSILNIDKKLAHFNDAKGKSVLSIALEHNKPDISQLLLSYGSNIAEALESNKAIKHLNLSNTHLDQYQIDTIAEDLKFNNNIIYLILKNSGLKAGNTNHLWEFLKSSWLNHIDISNNNLGYEGTKIFAKALEQNTSVKSINLSQNNIAEAGAIFIATLLQGNKHIVSIKLASNNIGDVGAIFIANALGHNTSIAAIDFASNNIGNKGVECLAETLTVNNSIALIELRFNNINVQGLNFLVQSLKTNISLISLLGLNDQEQYISTRVSQNNESFLANIKSFESLETIKHLDKDNIFKKLFISLKQLQSQNLPFQEQVIDQLQQKFYFQKIIEAYNYFSLSQVPTNIEEEVYFSELSGQLADIQDSY